MDRLICNLYVISELIFSATYLIPKIFTDRRQCNYYLVKASEKSSVYSAKMTPLHAVFASDIFMQKQ